MTDFSIIQNHGQRFTPEDAVGLHMASRDWLTAMLAEPFAHNESGHPPCAPNLAYKLLLI